MPPENFNFPIYKNLKSLIGPYATVEIAVQTFNMEPYHLLQRLTALTVPSESPWLAGKVLALHDLWITNTVGPVICNQIAQDNHQKIGTPFGRIKKISPKELKIATFELANRILPIARNEILDDMAIRFLTGCGKTTSKQIPAIFIQQGFAKSDPAKMMCGFRITNIT